MQRFFIPVLEEKDDSLTIKNPQMLSQMIKVLRVSKGDQYIFFNGEDQIDYIFEIVSVDKREIYLEKVSQTENTSEIDFQLNIINAMPNKLDKIEYIIQKGVEIGVTGFYFYRSVRSQKLNLSENKIERLEKIIIEAVEQSGRSYIPELIIEDHLDINMVEGQQNIFFHTAGDGALSLCEIEIDKEKGINIFVGPEGGFSEEEINLFEENNFQKAYLGERILRTETAGIVTAFYMIQK